MSARQSQALDAIAFHLVAAVELYGESTEQMLASWPHEFTHDTTAVHMEEIRRYCMALPQMAVPLVAVLIAGAELLQCLWLAAGCLSLEKVDACARDHRAACRGLRQKCLRFLDAGAKEKGHAG